MHSILEIKRKNKYVFLLQFEEGHVILFKILSLGEYKVLIETIQNFPHTYDEIVDNVFRDCVLEYMWGNLVYSSDQNNFYDLLEVIPAGVVESVVELIFFLSGTTNLEKLLSDLDIVRVNIQYEFNDMLYLWMASVYGDMNLDYNNMYYYDFLQRLAVFEMIGTGTVPELPLQLQKQTPKKEGIDFEAENKAFFKEFQQKQE